MTDPTTPVTLGRDPRASGDKPLSAMTDDELREERAKWHRKIVDAPHWGASLAAAAQFRDQCDRELRRRAAASEPPAACHDCARPYGAAHGFPDLIVPYEAWQRISPTGDDGGLLCPSCLCKRLHDAGIVCEAAFMSGPIESVSRTTMYALRRIENLELVLEGRANRWGEAFDSRVDAVVGRRLEALIGEDGPYRLQGRAGLADEPIGALAK
jgi:hypothetical protein